MAEKEFKYDPEAEDKAKHTRLPFALCKSRGIQIQDWWTPRDAWDALKSGGHVQDVSEEYRQYYLDLKKKRQRERAKIYRNRSAAKKKQMNDPDHSPTKGYTHQDGAIDSAVKGTPMTFEQADSGNCNPHFGDYSKIGYRHNCQTCVAVYVARRQGYDVTALPNLNNENIYRLSYDTALAYRTEQGRHPAQIAKRRGQTNYDFLQETVKEGGIYSLEFQWAGRTSGHIITVEKDSAGNIRLYDPQTNQLTEGKEKIKSYLARTNTQRVMDLTSVKMDESFCDKIMKGKRR